MANQITGNPIILDTPGGGILTIRRFSVYLVRWVAPAAVAGHQVRIYDSNGREKWASVANGTNYVEADHLQDREDWQGFDLQVLDTGRLFLYTR